MHGLRTVCGLELGLGFQQTHIALHIACTQTIEVIYITFCMITCVGEMNNLFSYFLVFSSSSRILQLV